MIQKLHYVGLVVLVAFLASCGASRAVNQGDKKFAREEYEAAIQEYQKALAKGKDVAIINYKIGEAYRRSNRLPQAEPFYKTAFDANLKREDLYFYYALALKSNARYDEASAQMQNYLTVGSNRALKARAQREAENLKAVRDILEKSLNYELRNLETINTPASEFAPVLVNGEVYFSSTRDGAVYAGNGEGFNDLFSIKFDNPNELTGGAVRKINAPINQPETHESSATFTPDGNTMVFARSNTGKRRGRQNVDLFASQYREGGWTEPKLISISDETAWDASPAFAPDGRTLYFVSDRKGGKGGNDIYKTTLSANGRFSRPVNLGDAINTPGNDNFPAVAPNSTLYISSDGHPGLGMMDIFRIEGDSAVNLGTPINSAADDFAYLQLDEFNILFSSNRPGGMGGDDIYLARKSELKRVNFIVDGTVIERRPGQPNTPPVENIVVLLQDRNGQRISDAVTDSQGRFSFRLDSASVYSVVAERPGFFTARQQVTTVGKTPLQSELTQPITDIRLTATLPLVPIVKDQAIVVENIFYDLDKAEIRPDAAEELDKLVQTLKDNPRISIELSSHTDTRASDEYNMDLSQRRAQSAVDYIISKGIDANRITARGYGETRLVVPNAQNEEEHQRNRRTEFRVIRIEE